MTNNAHKFRLICTSWVLLFTLSFGLLSAQEESEPTAELPTSETIEQRIQEIESSAKLSDAEKGKILSLYNQALTELSAITELSAKRQAFHESISGLPEERSKFEEEIKNYAETPNIDTEGKSIQQLSKEAQNAGAEVQDAQRKLDIIGNEPARRAGLRLKIPAMMAELNRQSSELNRESQAPTTDESSEMSAAKSLFNQIEQRRVSVELDKLKIESNYYSLAEEVLTLEIDAAKEKVAYLTTIQRLWQTASNSQQALEIDKAIKEATATKAAAPSELKQIAETNLKMIEEWKRQKDLLADANERVYATRKQRSEWDDEFDKSREMIAAQGGVTTSVGLILRNQKRDLPNIRQLNLTRRRDQVEIIELRDRLYSTTQELESLKELDEFTREELANINPPLSAEQQKQLEAPARSLMEQRVTILSGSRDTDRDRLQSLLNLSLASERLFDVVTDIDTYIDQQVLWIPSSRRIDFTEVRGAIETFRKLFSISLWRQVVIAFPQNLRQQPLPQSIFFLAGLWLLFRRRHFLRVINRLGQTASARSCHRFDMTFHTLLATLALASAVPVLIFAVSMNLALTENAELMATTYPISEAFEHAAVFYFYLNFWYYLVIPQGLGESHFDWPEAFLTVSRRNLTWFAPLFVLGISLQHYVESLDESQAGASTGRISLTLWLVVSTVFLFLVFSPKRGAFSNYLQEHSQGWLDRTKHIWFGFIVLSPICFLTLAAAGYAYTATELASRLSVTFFFLGGIFVLESLALRWVRMNRRELAFAQARERVAAENANPEEDTADRIGGVVEGDLVDLTAINEQTKRLFQNFGIVIAIIGLYIIWESMLPALKRLDEIHLWPTAINNIVVDSNGTTDNGTASQTSAPLLSSEWVSLSDLLLAILIIFLTLVATKNIPGLLEISILKRLPLDAALRYAISTVTRYGVIICGAAITFACLGIRWGQIQWLLAGISVGLGFGLQEIFANFVSGLILLFERPLRAGDIVTIGNITGRVVQIKMRATTIVDYDRKELIVPNKEFITNQLLNWTLTDTTNRLVLTVGVAYGSDTDRVRAILLEILNDHPKILTTPGPSVAFDQFGDSALNFTIRAFLADMDNRISVTSELHAQIHKALAEAGIEIPFPQQDVYIKTMPDPKTPPQ